MTSQRHQQLQAFLRRLGLNLEANKSTFSSPLEGSCRFDAIDEAFTHTSAALPRNHERLEFLGDAVLRLAAAEFLQRLQPPLDVGTCSALRAQLVSDRWLNELAITCQLDPLIHLGPKALSDHAGRATVRAEICEALVGGIYEAWGGARGGLVAVHTWLDPHWHKASTELQADPHRHNWKSALQEWTQGQGVGLPAYHCEERSRIHGDPRRFYCVVSIPPTSAQPLPQSQGSGWGGSRREAEQQAARQALTTLQVGSAPQR